LQRRRDFGGDQRQQVIQLEAVYGNRPAGVSLSIMCSTRSKMGTPFVVEFISTWYIHKPLYFYYIIVNHIHSTFCFFFFKKIGSLWSNENAKYNIQHPVTTLPFLLYFHPCRFPLIIMHIHTTFVLESPSLITRRIVTIWLCTVTQIKKTFIEHCEKKICPPFYSSFITFL